MSPRRVKFAETEERERQPLIKFLNNNESLTFRENKAGRGRFSLPFLKVISS